MALRRAARYLSYGATAYCVSKLGAYLYNCTFREHRRENIDDGVPSPEDKKDHFQKSYFKNDNGYWIFRKAWLPEDMESLKGVVFLVHGYGEYISRYDFFAKILNDNGFAVFGQDHYAHGRSQGNTRGYFYSFEDLCKDVVHHVKIVKAEYPELMAKLPTFLFGHSMGGLVAARVVQLPGVQRLFSGLLLSGPLFKDGDNIPSRPPVIVQRMFESLSTIIPRLELPILPEMTESISRDETVQFAYKNDPLVTKCGVFLRVMSQLTKYSLLAVEESNLVTLPLLCMHGVSDKIVSVDGTKDFFENASSRDKELHLMSGMFHEILNEKGFESVAEKIVDWLAKRGIEQPAYIFKAANERQSSSSQKTGRGKGPFKFTGSDGNESTGNKNPDFLSDIKKLRKVETNNESREALHLRSRPSKKPAFLNDIKKIKSKQKKPHKNRGAKRGGGGTSELLDVRKKTTGDGKKSENLSDVRKRPMMPFLKDITERTSKKAKKKKLAVRPSHPAGEDNAGKKNNNAFDKLEWLKKTPKKKKGANPASMMAEIQKKREKLRSRKKNQRPPPSSDKTKNPKAELERAMERRRKGKPVKGTPPSKGDGGKGKK